jgi:hypothetical protein
MNIRSITQLRRPVTFALAAIVAGCGGGDPEPATTRAETESVAACDLITEPEAVAILGAAEAEPRAHHGDGNSICTLVGAKGAVTIRLVYDYHRGESTSAAWAAELQQERREQAADETDPELKRLLATVLITPLGDLGVPAAVEDLRGSLGQVVWHVMKGGRGGTYLTVWADDMESARAITEKALPRLP